MIRVPSARIIVSLYCWKLGTMRLGESVTVWCLSQLKHVLMVCQTRSIAITPALHTIEITLRLQIDCSCVTSSGTTLSNQQCSVPSLDSLHFMCQVSWLEVLLSKKNSSNCSSFFLHLASGWLLTGVLTLMTLIIRAGDLGLSTESSPKKFSHHHCYISQRAAPGEEKSSLWPKSTTYSHSIW